MRIPIHHMRLYVVLPKQLYQDSLHFHLLSSIIFTQCKLVYIMPTSRQFVNTIYIIFLLILISLHTVAERLHSKLIIY